MISCWFSRKKWRNPFKSLVSNGDNHEGCKGTRTVPIHTDRCCDIDGLSIKGGQHLLEVYALQIDLVTAYEDLQALPTRTSGSTPSGSYRRCIRINTGEGASILP